MTADQTCALPGCNKPPWPSPDRTSPHLACGNLHHQLLMAARFNPTPPHPHPHQQILDLNYAGLCALPSCHKPPHPGHSWCSKSHYLTWLADFTLSLHQDHICKLPSCTRHVFVEVDGLSSQFCSWRHHQKYVMRSALQRRHQQLTHSQSLNSSSLSSVKSNSSHVPSVDSLVHYLRDYAHSRNAPKNVKVDEDFFDKHPWDVCTEGHTSLLIARCKRMSKGKRVMVTKDNYHWKQQGPAAPSKSNDFTMKYFTYKRLQGKQNDAGKHHDGSAYHLEEYTIEGVENFSLIKLRKKTRGSIRHRKGRPAADGKQSGNDVTDTCSQITPLSSADEMCADSCFWNLSPLDECLPYFDQIPN